MRTYNKRIKELIRLAISEKEMMELLPDIKNENEDKGFDINSIYYLLYKYDNKIEIILGKFKEPYLSNNTHWFNCYFAVIHFDRYFLNYYKNIKLFKFNSDENQMLDYMETINFIDPKLSFTEKIIEIKKIIDNDRNGYGDSGKSSFNSPYHVKSEVLNTLI